MPADTCHQVHLANEIQGAASSTTLPPAFRLAWKRDVVLGSSWRNGAPRTHCGGQTIFPPGLSLVVRQTVHSVARMFYNICVFKGRSAGWRLYLHFFLGRWTSVDSAAVYSWAATGSSREEVVSLSISF